MAPESRGRVRNRAWMCGDGARHGVASVEQSFAFCLTTDTNGQPLSFLHRNRTLWRKT
ncbi:hypothetical protein CBM2586_A11794 [Cupriavidus phytorum]|uniref:Uncharacterized protein n=1 Tax=Cupriavidus taiwanensis TaxID=164546 RepID=A0A975WT90_9BURK|nr:hypothetical protein CBM2586_A11794 [Cupriavidus taiwanensis]